MALHTVASFENGLIMVQVQYHDGNKRVQTVICTNLSTVKLRGTLIDPQNNNEIVAQTVFPIGVTNINIPQGKTVTIDPDIGLIMPYNTNWDLLPG